MQLTGHRFDVPVDYGDPSGSRLSFFAREVVAEERAGHDLPWLVFFQGGPGYEGPRPLKRDGWLGAALQRYRVLLLDSRGTGRSSPVNAERLAALGSVEAQADYLGLHRADAIVADAEWARRELCGSEAWTVLGQSFGGFCALHYLSAAPESLAAVLITGGIPPLGVAIDDVYRATYASVSQRNADYRARYPDDGERLQRLARQLLEHDVRLPAGDRLLPRRLAQLGLAFGMSDGFEQVHYLLELADDDVPGGGQAFLRALDHQLPYQVHPIFSLLHEAAYCEGSASRWSAQRVRAEIPAFDAGPDAPLLFTGEMIYPWMFEDYAALMPMAAVAERLAQREDWPALYDSRRLAANTVPTVAAVYANDMYVDRALSERAARGIGRLSTWVTGAYEHDGLRVHGDVVLPHLLAMLDQQT